MRTGHSNDCVIGACDNWNFVVDEMHALRPFLLRAQRCSARDWFAGTMLVVVVVAG